MTQLLEDIRDFTQRKKPQPEEFYCLQPLVLRPNDDGAFEVVDGQQRLHTISHPKVAMQRKPCSGMIMADLNTVSSAEVLHI